MTAKSEHKPEKAEHKQAEQKQNGLEIQDLTKLLQGDLTSVDIETAVEAIDHYQTALQKSEDKGLEAIANHLKELKKLLKANHADAAKIAETLTQLGEETEKFSADLEKDEKSQTQKLGKALTKAGQSLSKAHADEDAEDSDEDEDETPEVESLLDTLKGDITEIEPEEGNEAIDEWLEVLKGSKDENLKEISNSLKELKKLLKKKNAEGSEIAELLTKLGEQTENFAANAERGVKGKVQKLGKALTKAGKAIK